MILFKLEMDIVNYFLHTELNGANFFMSWLFELLPKVFHIVYKGPTRPTPPTFNNIVYAFNKKADIKRVYQEMGLYLVFLIQTTL